MPNSMHLQGLYSIAHFVGLQPKDLESAFEVLSERGWSDRAIVNGCKPLIVYFAAREQKFASVKEMVNQLQHFSTKLIVNEVGVDSAHFVRELTQVIPRL